MTVVVYFATNRNEEGTDQAPNFGPFFHAKGPSYLRFGRERPHRYGRSRSPPPDRQFTEGMLR